MTHKPKHAVTGAYGYSGKYIATRLLAHQREVVTLTVGPADVSGIRGLRGWPLPLATDPCG